MNVLEVFDRADDILISTGREDMHALASDLNEVKMAVLHLLAAVRHGQWMRGQPMSATDVLALRNRIDMAVHNFGDMK